MSDFLQQDYDIFIARKLERGQYESILNRLDNRNRKILHDFILDITKTIEPTLDTEFMDRVGDKIVSLKDRADG